MSSLILRESGLDNKERAWALQIRHHDCCGPTDYDTLAYVSLETAREITRMGPATWLYGDPDRPRPLEEAARLTAVQQDLREIGRGEGGSREPTPPLIEAPDGEAAGFDLYTCPSDRRIVGLTGAVNLDTSQLVTSVIAQETVTEGEARRAVTALMRSLSERFCSSRGVRHGPENQVVDLASPLTSQGYDRDGAASILEKFVADGTTLDGPRDLDVLLDALAEAFRPGAGNTPW